MIWSEIVGQTEVITWLQKAIESGRLSHAYLFWGPTGVGKRTIAKVFASALNCRDGGCGSCLSCIKIDHETHPDIFFIEPEGNFLNIDQIRELQREVSLKPFEGKIKVCILDEVDRMTSPAANALLKTLEEPPPDLIFILITANLEGILPTIVSRCQLIRFKLVPSSKMVDILAAKYGMSRGQARLITLVSGGILGNALSLAASPWRLRRREIVLDIVEGIWDAGAVELSEAAGRLISEVKRPLRDLKEIQKKELETIEDLAFNKAHAMRMRKRLDQRYKRETSHQERQGFEEILNILASWYRDLLILTPIYRGENLLVNMDRIESLKRLSRNISLSQAQKAIEIIEGTKQLMRFNVNMHLAFEVMLFKLQEV